MEQPLGERLNEAESQQAQAERDVAAQFDAIRRELALENDAANTPLDEVRNMKHLIKAVTCRDWHDLRQSGAFFDWNCDELARGLGKVKRAAPSRDGDASKRPCPCDANDLITFAQSMIDMNKNSYEVDADAFHVESASVHIDLARVRRMPDAGCELARVEFAYGRYKDELDDDPVYGTVYVKLVKHDMLRFYMECFNEPTWADIDSDDDSGDDSDDDDDDDDDDDSRPKDWIFDVRWSAGEEFSTFECRHGNAMDDVPLYARDILGEDCAICEARWPCILLSMLVYTSSAANELTDRTSERIRKSDFRDVATILKPFFDIDANPDTFIYPFFKSLISSEFYDLIRPLYDKSLFYISA